MEAVQEQHELQNSDSMEAEQEQHEPQNSDSMEAEQEQHEPQNSGQRARETSYKKRNPTVMKKANELSQLCNIPVCVISYGPDGNVDTWPESRDDVVEVLNKYKDHSGIHKKYPFVNKEKNNNKEEKEEDEEEEEEDDDEEEEDEEDVDESEEDEERNKVEEFERVLLAWEYGWLYDTDDEKLFEMRLNSLKTKLCVMKNRIELLENKKRKWSNNNNNNNSTTSIPNNNNNYEVGSSSGSSRAEVASAYRLMSTVRRLNLPKMSLSQCSQ